MDICEAQRETKTDNDGGKSEAVIDRPSFYWIYL